MSSDGRHRRRGAAPAARQSSSNDDFHRQREPRVIWPELDREQPHRACATPLVPPATPRAFCKFAPDLLPCCTALASNLGRQHRDQPQKTVVLPVVPMFPTSKRLGRAPYACPMVGAAMVMPGPGLGPGPVRW